VSQNAGELKLQFADGEVTVTLAEATADPPSPVHVRLYAEFAAGVTVSDPFIACAPPQLPDAEQLVALVELHMRTEGWPAVTDIGVAVRSTVGINVVERPTLADAAADPPAPVQVRV
jgi:hypothetical protein